MKKAKKKHWIDEHVKLTVVLVTLGLLILVGSYFAWAKYAMINDAATQASMVQVRSLILASVEDLKKDVPVEARTGDLYFPESKLFLPNPKTFKKYTYAWYPGDESMQEELSVSLSQVPGTSGLYGARNIDEMFDKVPKLQACSQGIKLVYKQINNSDIKLDLVKKLTLSNGRELYIYVPTVCFELNQVAETLYNIQPY